jgi:hypothetical protein
MQELILVISRCVSKRKSVKGAHSFYRFHFKGYYAGERIKIIHLFPSESETSLSKGDDYLLWVKRRRVHNEILEVELITFKKID